MASKRWKAPQECPICYCRTILSMKVSHDVYAGKRIVRFPQVSMRICAQCGTRFFDPQVLRTLERQAKAKKLSANATVLTTSSR